MYKKAMRSLMLGACLTLFSAATFAATAPKYVFYFIGDGLGPSQRQAAEYYYKMETGKKDAKLMMNSLPVAALTTTYSANTLITDSAAAGTALATGYKTTNGVLSKMPDGRDILTIAESAKKNGYKVGIVTSTRLTHATPAAFSAHNMSRNNADAIAVDQLNSGFDFFAGGGYRYFVPKGNKMGLKSKRKDKRNVAAEFKAKGYKTFVGDNVRDAFRNYKPKKGEKVFAALAYSHIPYEVVRRNSKLKKNKHMALSEMTAKAIQTLDKQGKPFFMMVEGGRIDHAAHAHDAKSAILDTIALDKAVKVAYEFYKKHPKETLIVTAADHETGGIGLGISLDSKGYFLKLSELDNIKESAEDQLKKAYNKIAKKISNVEERHAAFVKYVEKNWGLTNRTIGEDKELNDAMYVQDRNQSLPKAQKTLYGYGYTPTMVAVTNIMSNRARISWTSFVHTGTVVPLSAIGVGAQKFAGFFDNTQIPRRIAKVMNIKLDGKAFEDSEALLGATTGPQTKYSKIPYTK